MNPGLYLSVINDAMETSVSMKLYKNIASASIACITRSYSGTFNLNNIDSLNNFNVERLKDTAVLAFPVNDRPRGIKDIKSVNYWKKIFLNNDKSTWVPIVIHVSKNKKYTLLDGQHRIIASWIIKNNILNCIYVT